MSESEILIIGLPETGKTSFLAALQHYIDTEKKEKFLAKYQYSPNDEYLNRIHGRWLCCEQQVRTAQDQTGSQDVSMYLEVVETKKRFILNVPDVAGEVFSQQWQARSWEKSYIDKVIGICGIIFFIHPQTFKTHTLLTDIAPLVDLMEEGDFKVWDINDVPTQVVLVDLLQTHMDYAHAVPIPVAIVISAWDTVTIESQDITPADWLKTNMPLLHQYLKANNGVIEKEVFGISALGGDIKQPSQQDKLINFDEPGDRIIVQVGNKIHSDITEPIHWIMSRWNQD